MQIIQDGLALSEPAKPQATAASVPNEQTSPSSPPAALLKAVPSPAESAPANQTGASSPIPEAKPITSAAPVTVETPPAAQAPAKTAPNAPAPPPTPAAKPAQAPAAAPKPAPTTAPNPSTPAPEPVKMRPVAGPATFKRRHYGLMASFVCLVILPFILSAYYLFALANDQYASKAGFTIRQENGSSAGSILGGLSFLTGAGQGVNGSVLHEFMQSQAMLEKVDARIDLRAHYSQGWPRDPVYSIWPDATNEELFSFWKRVLRLSYDPTTGLIDLTVQALDPDTAQRIASVILEESQIMINRLNDTARRDATANAENDLQEAVEKLRAARSALTVFRAQTRIVDPVADIQGRLGVVSNLQQQLAQALVELDLLDPSTRADDPRREQFNRRINVIRNRIEEERNFFGNTEDQSYEDTYPEMIAKYEGLNVDLEFAEKNYVAALAAKQAALSNANRQTLYLAAYIPPTKAQDSEYPERFTLLAMIAGFLLLVWATLALIYYSLRDRG